MTFRLLIKNLFIALIAISIFSVGLAFYDTVVKNNFQIVEVEE